MLFKPLSPRETQILELLAHGNRVARIADCLGIKEVTVNLYIKNARHKLGAKTREEAVAMAVHMRLISPPQTRHTA